MKMVNSAKRIIAVLLTLTLLLSFLPTVSAAQEPAKVSLDTAKLGDINLDGDINIQDATALQKKLAGDGVTDEKEIGIADVNGNGKVDISDVTTIQKYIAEIITSFKQILREQELSASFKDYVVKVSGKLPDGAALKVSELAKEVVDKILAKMGADSSFFACDIKIIDKYGNEWQPDEAVKVTVSGVDEVSIDDSVCVYHISGDVEQIAQSQNPDELISTINQVDVDNYQKEATFETNGFSAFLGASTALASDAAGDETSETAPSIDYATKFAGNGKIYVINVNKYENLTTVPVTRILSKLDLKHKDEKKTAISDSDITSVTSGNISFIKAEKVDNVYTVKVLKQVTSEVTLTVKYNQKTYDTTTKKTSTSELTKTIKISDYTVTKRSNLLPTKESGNIIVQGTDGSRYYYPDTTANTKDNSLWFADPCDNNLAESNIKYAPGFTICKQDDSSKYAGAYWVYKETSDVLSLKIPRGTTAIHLSGPIRVENGVKLEIWIDELEDDKPCTIYRSGHWSDAKSEYIGYRPAWGMISLAPGASFEIRGTNGKRKLIFSGDRYEGDTNYHTSEVAMIRSDDVNDDANYGGASGKTDSTLNYSTKFNPRGLIYIKDTTFERLRFVNKTNNTTSSWGGAVYIGDNIKTQVSFLRCKFSDLKYHFNSDDEKNDNTRFCGAGIYIKTGFRTSALATSDSTHTEHANENEFAVNIVDCNFDNLKAHRGAGIYYGIQKFNDSGKYDVINYFNIKNTTFKNCAADFQYKTGTDKFQVASGGAIWLAGFVSKNMLIENTTFDGCESTNGSAILINRKAAIKKCTLKDLTVTNCRTSNYGLTDTFLESNSTYGGSIKTDGESSVDLEVQGGKFTNNYSHSQGGALYFNATGVGSKCLMTASSAGIAPKDYHYRDKESDDFTVGEGMTSQFTIKGLTTTDEEGNSTTKNCVISGNRADLKGGGIYTEAVTTIENCTINGNSTDAYANGLNYGGGIHQQVYNNNSATVTGTDTTLNLNSGVDIFDNTAKIGGGVSILVNGSANVYRDAKKTNGMGYNVTFNLDGAKIHNNTATEMGGGIAYFPRAYNTIKCENADLNDNVLTKTQIETMIAGYSKSINVGTATNKAQIYDNTSGDLGGGIYVQGVDSQVNVNNAEIVGNTSVHGGGIYIKDKGAAVNVNGGGIGEKSETATVDGEQVTTTTPDGNIASGNGGGVYATDGAGVNITSGSINYNRADNGGAVYAVNGGDVKMTGGFVRDNIARPSSRAPIAGVDTSKTNKLDDLHGVGGGIFIANGITAQEKTEETPAIAEDYSTFTIDKPKEQTAAETDADAKTKVGIYNNLASFAADDVYANSNKTKLNVPAFGEMTLTDVNDPNVADWYEDYNEGDTCYIYGLKGNDATDATGIRYKPIPANESNKRIRAKINAVEEIGDKTYNNTVYANKADTYVCMTLGMKSTGGLTVTKNVEDSQGNNINDVINEKNPDAVFTFTLTDNDGNALVGKTYYLYDINGVVDYTKTYPTDDNGQFTLKVGERAEFTDITAGSSVKIKESNDAADEKSNKLNEIYDYVTDIKAEHNDKDLELEKTYNSTDSTKIDTAESKTAVTVTSGETQAIVVTSVVKSLVVTLKYYDRLQIPGLPANINSNATVYEKYFLGNEIDEKAKDLGLAGNYTTEDFIYAYATKYKPDNPLDNYYFWKSQAEATGENGIVKRSNSDLNRTYAQNTQYHTNRYGLTQTDGNWNSVTLDNGKECTDNYSIADSEKWVTVNKLDSEKADTDLSNVTSITLWYFNQPKTYDVNVINDYNSTSTTADSEDDSKEPMYKMYYNQRLGVNFNQGQQDADTEHLRAYGLKGVTGNKAYSTVVTGDGEAKQFSHWAFDPKGDKVASTDINYNYRIVNHTDLYAIYKDEPSKTPGLAVSYLQQDKYFDKNGTPMVRINTVINPYNYIKTETVKGEDGTETIKKTAVQPKMVGVIYVVLPEGASNELKESIQAGIKNYLEKAENSNTLVAGARKLTITYTVKTGDVEEQKTGRVNAYLYNTTTQNDLEAQPTTGFNANLTNKMRCNFVMNFTQKQFESMNIMALGVMKYGDEKNDTGVKDDDTVVDQEETTGTTESSSSETPTESDDGEDSGETGDGETSEGTPEPAEDTGKWYLSDNFIFYSQGNFVSA